MTRISPETRFIPERVRGAIGLESLVKGFNGLVYHFISLVGVGLYAMTCSTYISQ